MLNIGRQKDFGNGLFRDEQDFGNTLLGDVDLICICVGVEWLAASQPPEPRW